RLVNPFAAHPRVLRGDNTPMRDFHRRTTAPTRPEAECSQRIHVEPAIGGNTEARLECAQRKFQIRSKYAVAFTSVKSSPPQQRLRTENNALLQFRRRRFVGCVPENTRCRLCWRWLLSISLKIARRRRWCDSLRAIFGALQILWLGRGRRRCRGRSRVRV